MKPAFALGIGVGLATGAWMFAEHALGLHDSPTGAGRWTGFLALAFPALGAWRLGARSGLSSWAQAARAGLVFGSAGGAVGAAAIWLYFAVVNPGFQIGGRPVAPGPQAAAGFVGALVLGALLTLAAFAWSRRSSAGRRS